MTLPPSHISPDACMEWERETWADRLASQSGFKNVDPDVPTPPSQEPAPSTYMTIMYDGRYGLATTHYHARSHTWVVHGTDSLLSADYAPNVHTYTTLGGLDGPHIQGTWGHASLETLHSIHSSCQVLSRAMYCLAQWTQRSWQIPPHRWTWEVTLRPRQREAPQNCRRPILPRSFSMQLCRFMVAARLLPSALLRQSLLAVKPGLGIPSRCCSLLLSHLLGMVQCEESVISYLSSHSLPYPVH